MCRICRNWRYSYNTEVEEHIDICYRCIESIEKMKYVECKRIMNNINFASDIHKKIMEYTKRSINTFILDNENIFNLKGFISDKRLLRQFLKGIEEDIEIVSVRVAMEKLYREALERKAILTKAEVNSIYNFTNGVYVVASKALGISRKFDKEDIEWLIQIDRMIDKTYMGSQMTQKKAIEYIQKKINNEDM